MEKHYDEREIVELPCRFVKRSIIILTKAIQEYKYDVIDSELIDRMLNELERAESGNDKAGLLKSWAYLLSQAVKEAKNYPDDYGLSVDELDELDIELDNLRNR